MRNKLRKIIEVKGAWLITWEFHSGDEDKKLKEFGIRDKVVDIVNSRKDLGFMREHTKSLYKVLWGDYSCKVSSAKRKKRGEKEDLFYSPILTPYRSTLYRKLIDNFEKGIRDEEAVKQWARSPQYVSVGNNPSFYARRVRNVRVYEITGIKELLCWEEKIVSGEWVKKEYTKP